MARPAHCGCLPVTVALILHPNKSRDRLKVRYWYVLESPSIVCRVLRPMLDPIVASKGDLLAVWPGHPTHALIVFEADGMTALRWAPCPEGVLYGALLGLYLDAVLAALTVKSERSLLRVA